MLFLPPAYLHVGGFPASHNAVARAVPAPAVVRSVTYAASHLDDDSSWSVGGTGQCVGVAASVVVASFAHLLRRRVSRRLRRQRLFHCSTLRSVKKEQHNRDEIEREDERRHDTSLEVSTTAKLRVDCFAAMEPKHRLQQWAYDIDLKPGRGEVDVAITHVGVCHSDIHHIDNAWGVASFPLVPGHEIVGKVVAVGAGGEQRLRVGDVVAIGAQRGNCEDCSHCHSGLENLCSDGLKTYGGPQNNKGGFAKLIRYPSKWAFKCPTALRPEHAAPLMCAGITVFSPLKRFLLQDPGCVQGKKVGIIGIGGLGHLAVQFASKMGATVVGISQTREKASEACSLGASEFLMSTDCTQMEAAVGTFDLLLNTVSGTEELDSYLALLKPRGVMACVGLPEKIEKSRLFLHSVVQQERVVCGSKLGPYADYAEMLAFACDHSVKPMVELFPIGRVNEAIDRVRQNTARYRCVLVL
eukprot:TRINITY_DN69681_c0_g1_i1.p1 TRINITY_DN69681_c0_g1~~TRINITY_DN69681_c0_g1_i1.p1  ORF type:complete len:469 (+),score=75.66 TRINITY_DN69681_c0_g1_i1:35-1441(+)